jgi:hypothetical protein
MRKCQNAEPGTYGQECAKPAQWTATNKQGHNAAFCEQCKSTGTEAKRYGNWTEYSPTPATSPTCTHGKGFKCRQCWPIQYWITNP